MIKNFLNKYSDAGILFLRIGIGFAFIFVHGWGKIFGGPELWGKLGGSMANLGITFAPVFWGFMAAAAEFGGGILILFGLFTRPASAFMAFTMLVAFLQHTSKLDPWNRVIYPMEMFAVFMALLFIGAGKYSIDALISKKK
ncbi:MAG TPA: DoxX family protein [Ignavibacteria bacterium]|nr:DoxX family protein [Ignavibacteria bacterium]HRE09641.1 DoxX family protein [Ignavibacteria bacterium]HRF64340.1 DoxX family protein [Ignavibacteria bacterium]HRJ05815.1 DoxX family protein [Ignavibacteria bacterium]HRJ86604.1 DoxX family protein [Ignavibacteria bacterium]